MPGSDFKFGFQRVKFGPWPVDPGSGPEDYLVMGYGHVSTFHLASLESSISDGATSISVCDQNQISPRDLNFPCQIFPPICFAHSQTNQEFSADCRGSALSYFVKRRRLFDSGCLRVRGGRGKRNDDDGDEAPATTRAGAGGSALTPRMFGKKRRGPDTYATDTEQLRFDERFRGAGESELSALQAEEAELRGTGNYASAEESPPPPPSTSDDDPARRQRVSDGNLDAAAEAAVAAWDEEERGEEEKIRPITFEYDHVQAAAELEAEERQRFSLSLAPSPSLSRSLPLPILEAEERSRPAPRCA